MTSKKNRQLAYGVAIALFVVGVISYAYTAISAKPPDQPIRLMYKVAAGNVVFDHKSHADIGGYGMNCADCHHHPEDDESANQACGNCHAPPSRAETVRDNCLDCHEEDEIEESVPPKRGDAFHQQCSNCHKEIGSGPVFPLNEECSACHRKN
jgi:hypothetical protein